MEKGLYWHVHHEELAEYCYDPEGRIDYMKAAKKESELPRRLRLMRPVTPAPEVQPIIDRLQTVASFWKEGEYHVSYRFALTFDEMDILSKYHSKDCPNCPWNGRTIFPKGFSWLRWKLKNLNRLLER